VLMLGLGVATGSEYGAERGRAAALRHLVRQFRLLAL
jgi:hypothetical protein